MSEHSVLSPSSSSRWIPCPGSVAAVIAAGKDGDNSNPAAREGTAAHTLAERALNYDKPAAFWIGESITVPYELIDGTRKYDVFLVDEEMAANVQMYVDAVKREPGQLLVEQELDMSQVYGVPHQKGTGDAVVLDFDSGTIGVHDLKYGRGVQVFADNNPQLLSYGAAAFLAYALLGDWQRVKVAIHQPRLNHYDEHTYTIDELRAFMVKAQTAAQKAADLIGGYADEIEAAKVAGPDQCQWCPIKGDCAVLAAYVHQTLFESFQDVTDMTNPNLQVKNVVTLTPEERAAILSRRDIVSSFMSEVESTSLNLAQSGTKIPGWKVVQGRKGPRQWEDESVAEELLKKTAKLKVDQMYTKKVISPTQAEKVLKPKPKIWAKLLAIVTQSQGKDALVPENDKRPEILTQTAFNNTDIQDLF